MDSETNQYQSSIFERASKLLITNEVTKILKEQSEEKTTNLGPELGQQPHPFDFHQATRLKRYNSYHSACIDTKVSCLTGMGFKNGKEYDKLDPLTTHGYHVEEQKCSMDFAETGNWYMEIVREEPNPTAPIRAINHIPSKNVFVDIIKEEGDEFSYAIEYKITQMNSINPEATYPRFGDLESHIERTGSVDNVSEIIHIMDPSNKSVFYGEPGWLAALFPIELSHCNYNYLYDFFLNRGVPEFMLFLKGEIDNKTYIRIEEAIKAHIGLSNSHKSLLAKLPLNSEVLLEKLGIDQKGEKTFSDLEDTLALNTVSAHRVPPLLAGIQIPGKMGAANELPNGIMAYQLLEIGPDQNTIMGQLRNTLGDGSKNGGLGLGRSDFEYKKITDEFDLFAMDTQSRMRETAVEANARGRDPRQGLMD